MVNPISSPLIVNPFPASPQNIQLSFQIETEDPDAIVVFDEAAYLDDEEGNESGKLLDLDRLEDDLHASHTIPIPQSGNLIVRIHHNLDEGTETTFSVPIFFEGSNNYTIIIG